MVLPDTHDKRLLLWVFGVLWIADDVVTQELLDSGFLESLQLLQSVSNFAGAAF